MDATGVFADAAASVHRRRTLIHINLRVACLSRLCTKSISVEKSNKCWASFVNIVSKRVLFFLINKSSLGDEKTLTGCVFWNKVELRS